MRKEIFIEKTSKYISITSYLIGRLPVPNVEQIVTYLSSDVSNVEFGKAIRNKLSESREISEEVFMHYWDNKSELKEFNEKEEKKIIEVYGYGNKRSLYKDTLFVSVSILNNKLIMTPLHQDGLGSYGTVIEDGKGVDFEYPVTLLLSPEELGKAVIDAFKHSTSIYK